MENYDLNAFKAFFSKMGVFFYDDYIQMVAKEVGKTLVGIVSTRVGPKKLEQLATTSFIAHFNVFELKRNVVIVFPDLNDCFDGLDALVKTGEELRKHYPDVDPTRVEGKKRRLPIVFPYEPFRNRFVPYHLAPYFETSELIAQGPMIVLKSASNTANPPFRDFKPDIRIDYVVLGEKKPESSSQNLSSGSEIDGCKPEPKFSKSLE